MPYYVRINGRSHGPFDESKLAELKSRGTISRATEISNNDRDWYAAETYTFLYPAPPPPPPPPEPQEVIDPIPRWEPPVVPIQEKVGAFVQKVVDSFNVSEPESIPLLSRHTFVFLAISAGTFGVHDFYAKRNGQGAIHIACWVPWLVMLFSATSTILLRVLGVEVEIHWFDWVQSHSSLENAEWTVYCSLLFFVVIPIASHVMAMFEIVLVTKDGTGREFERF
jgi:hypothetical protein